MPPASVACMHQHPPHVLTACVCGMYSNMHTAEDRRHDGMHDGMHTGVHDGMHTGMHEGMHTGVHAQP